jgi:hypothetical protein
MPTKGKLGKKLLDICEDFPVVTFGGVERLPDNQVVAMAERIIKQTEVVKERLAQFVAEAKANGQ